MREIMLATRGNKGSADQPDVDERNLYDCFQLTREYLHTQCQRKGITLLLSALATVLCTPLLVWITETYPLASVSSRSLAATVIRLVSVVTTLSLAALLSFAHILLSDDDSADITIGEAVLLTLGLHLAPHWFSHGLGTLAVLSLIIAFCFLVELAYCDSPQSPHALAIRPIWWTMLSVSLCICLSFCLAFVGLLPYASGLPKNADDDERMLAHNLDAVQMLYDMEEWDVGCAEGARLIQTIVMVESRYLGIPPTEEPVVEMAPLPSPLTVAHYNSERNTIVISPYALRRTSRRVGPYVIRVACHEMAHAWQHRVINDPSILEDTRMPLAVSEGRIKTWKSEFRNYINGDYDTMEEYANQDCEVFANIYAINALDSYESRLQLR